MTTPSSVLAWRIPGMGEPGRLPSLGSHRVGHYRSDAAAAAAALRKFPVLQANIFRINISITLSVKQSMF